MKTSSLFLALLASSAATASTFSTARYQKRGKSSIVKAILELIGIATDSNANAWDFDAHPSMCRVSLGTREGGNCYASVTCNDGVTRWYQNWAGCAYQVVNNFTDPGIGPFSVIWTAKDDICFDGLCAPLLAFEYVGNYHVFDVNALASEAEHNADSDGKCKVGCPEQSPATNPNSENICQKYDQYGRSSKFNYACGVPAIGKSYGDGKLDSTGPVNEAGYAGPTCQVHVVQYQKKNPAGDPATDPEAHFSVDISIRDGNEATIGEVLRAEAPAGVAVGVTSKLPHVLLVTAGEVDADPVLFAYGDQTWAYADVAHKCNFGEYADGDREGDCEFSC